jgi:predicted small secreted protein
MMYPILLVVACSALLVAGCANTASDAAGQIKSVPPIRIVETGKAVGYTRFVYRGEVEILCEFISSDGRRTRFLSSNGERVISESDEDGDGFLETLTIFPMEFGTAEVFVRSKNGEITPMASDKLEELRTKVGHAGEQLRLLFQ